MIAAATNGNGAVQRYANWLVRLHELIRSGQDEGPAGEALRDAMDEAWKHLSPSEIRRLRGLSADLYTIGAARTAAQRPAAAEAAEFEAAVQREDWDTALTVLRARAGELSSREVAFCRGVCWAHLGQPDAALVFLNEADQLEPLRENEQIWLLSNLFLAGRMPEAVARAQDAALNSTSAPLLLMAAEILSVFAEETGLPAAATTFDLAISTAQKALDATADVSTDPLLDVLRPAALFHLALNFEGLGRRSEARQACEAALALNPKDELGLMLLGWLTFDGYPDQDRMGFRRDMHREIAAKRLPAVAPAA